MDLKIYFSMRNGTPIFALKDPTMNECI